MGEMVFQILMSKSTFYLTSCIFQDFFIAHLYEKYKILLRCSDATVETASRASRSSRASGVHSQNSPSRRQVRVSSSRHVSVTNSTSQPTVNSSTGHYVVESEERKTRSKLIVKY